MNAHPRRSASEPPALADVWSLALRAQQLHDLAQGADLELRRMVLALADAGTPRRIITTTVQHRLNPDAIHGVLRGAELLRILRPHLPGHVHEDHYPLLSQGYWRLRALESGRVEVMLDHHDPRIPEERLVLPRRLEYAVHAVHRLKTRTQVDWTPGEEEALVRALVDSEPVHVEVRRSYTGRRRSD